MPELEANRPRFFFECADLAPETFEVARFHGVEEIGVPFRFEVELLSKDPAVDFAAVLDRPATLTLRRGPHLRAIAGVVAELQQGGRSADQSEYRAVLVPRVARMGLGRRSRTFGGGIALPDLVKTLVGDAEADPVDLQLKDAAAFVPDRWVQHRESDLAFFSRRLEHAGAWFFFKTDGNRDQVVVADTRAAHAPIPGDDGIPYTEQSGMLAEQGTDTIDRFVVRQGMAVAESVARGWDGREGRRMEEAKQESAPGRRGTLAEHAASQRTEDGASAKLDPPSLAAAARVRAEAAWAWQRVAEGTSDAVRFLPGHLFTLTQHYREDLNTAYLLTRVEHEGSQRGALAAGAVAASDAGHTPARPEYRNAFEAVPASAPFRPKQRTAVPQIPGVTTGIVTGEVDERGDYRAAFQGDEDPAVDRAAVRLAQPYAGAGYGIHFPNLTDTEMVVAYLDGDADRPIALGAVPNGRTASPVTAENRTEHVVRTAAGNELVMDDVEKKASVRLQTVRQNQLTLRDEGGVVTLLTNGGHRARLADGGGQIELRTTGGHFIRLQDEKGEGDEAKNRISVQTAAGHFLALDDKEENITLSDKEGEHVFILDIKNNALEIRTAGSMKITAAEALEIEANEITMTSATKVTVDAGSEMAHTSGTTMELTAGTELAAAAGTSASVEAAMDLKLAGLNVASAAQMNHDTKGLNVTSEGSVNNTVKANVQAALQGSAIAKVSGGLVQIN